MNNWIHYKNGNYNVHIDLDTGTKIRENDNDYFEADFPESMDLKITNRCHNACTFCHENSTCDGDHGDIMSYSFIDNLHAGTEIAVGGGNPLEHPDLLPFLNKLKNLNLIPSMTIRQNDFMNNIDLIRKLRDNKLVYGLGISLVNPDEDGFIEAVKEFPNAVIHVINGIVTMPQFDALAGNDLKILILGYKQVRRGQQLYNCSDSEKNHIDGLKEDLYNYLPEIINHHWFDVVSFDNLAIQQLNPKRIVDEETWNNIYMGDDGIDGNLTSASMFVDMVERKFAKNSCDMERYDITDHIEDMFTRLKESTKHE